jgi:hypothetical protein
MHRWIILFGSIIALYCCNTKNREIILGDNLKAVGDIGRDTTYNGLIRFYNSKDGRLLYTCNYNDNILTGQKIFFHNNGTIYSKQNYSNGELNGFSFFYDSSGNLYSKQYFYYGVKAGHDVNYNTNHPCEYSFFSLENELLFYLNYDSLGNNKLTQEKPSYFFFKTRKFSLLSDTTGAKNTEYFIYLPNPPKFNFHYSLVTIDSSYNILAEKQVLDSNRIWDTFTIVDSTEKVAYAIRLVIIDSINNNDRYTMFKKLK